MVCCHRKSVLETGNTGIRVGTSQENAAHWATCHTFHFESHYVSQVCVDRGSCSLIPDFLLSTSRMSKERQELIIQWLCMDDYESS